MKLLLYSLSAFLCLNLLYGGSADSDIKKALEIKPKEVIRCSPDGRDNTLLPAHALAKISKGGELVFLPGVYNEIIIDQDSVVVSSESDSYLPLNLIIRGRNCIVRNLCIRRIELAGDTTIVNSCIPFIILSSQSDKKSSLIIYNSALSEIHSLSYDNEWNISIVNCNIRTATVFGLSQIQPLTDMVIDQEFAIRVMPRFIISIENSLISSNSYVFLFYLWERSLKTKLVIKDSTLFGKKGLGIIRSYYSNDKKDRSLILELKDLRKAAPTTFIGDNELQEISFLSNKPSDLEYFIPTQLKKKNRGIILNSNPILKKFADQSKTTENKTIEQKPENLPPQKVPEDEPKEKDAPQEKQDDVDVFEGAL